MTSLPLVDSAGSGQDITSSHRSNVSPTLSGSRSAKAHGDLSVCFQCHFDESTCSIMVV